MGKSTAADLLQKRGVQIIDTDQIARDLVRPGLPALREIEEVFGQEVISEDGNLDRANLAKLVFSDDSARRQLEAILHPRIRSVWLLQVEKWRAEGVRIGGVVIPLLFETSAQEHFDFILCVACTAATQTERLLARGWPLAGIEQRRVAQLPTEQKMGLADYVVWSEGTLDVHQQQLDRMLACED